MHIILQRRLLYRKVSTPESQSTEWELRMLFPTVCLLTIFCFDEPKMVLFANHHIPFRNYHFKSNHMLIQVKWQSQVEMKQNSKRRPKKTKLNQRKPNIWRECSGLGSPEQMVRIENEMESEKRLILIVNIDTHSHPCTHKFKRFVNAIPSIFGELI